ncbi:hypothetical protein KQX54_000179 [Cotesia glomerata]|uniref:Uncharacterized protein n=1 Tax=Cotesia glomerata TaxID=32391 RepID=A0AAV7IYQ4_COTGL|nr:hypothetical protein KQX54_000179 [Cotesia glomerata]
MGRSRDKLHYQIINAWQSTLSIHQELTMRECTPWSKTLASTVLIPMKVSAPRTNSEEATRQLHQFMLRKQVIICQPTIVKGRDTEEKRRRITNLILIDESYHGLKC